MIGAGSRSRYPVRHVSTWIRAISAASSLTGGTHADVGHPTTLCQIGSADARAMAT